jgi:hypothetical protein
MWRGLRHRASDRAGLHALRDNYLICTVHGNLGVVARCGRLVRSIMPEEGARSFVAIGRQRLCFCLQGHLGGADAFEAGGLVGHPVGHLVAAQLGAVFAIVRGVRRLGLGKPGRYFGGKLLLRLAHARIGHRLVHTGIGLNLSAAERHMSDLEVRTADRSASQD